jgi:outer membrane protein OmpA-like peptidoglycan-associated protein
MYSFRCSLYLVPIVMTLMAGDILYQNSSQAEIDLRKLSLSQAKLLKAKVLPVNSPEVRVPSVQFPADIYPEVKLPEMTSPQIRVQENKYLTIITLPADILFKYNQDVIYPSAEKILRQVSQAIHHHYPNTWLQILGHTDFKGSADDNLKLSEQQVAAVQRWLSEEGDIDSSLMSKEGYGESQPITANKKSNCSKNSAGQQKNSRIEIVIQKSVNNQV